MVARTVDLPRATNPTTGRREYTEEQLAILRPKWRRQWEDRTSLDADIINTIVREIHTGPNTYPGTRIAEASARGMNKHMKAVARKDPSLSGSRIFREARTRMNDEVREFNRAYGYNDSDPWGVEYYLTKAQRKRRRSSWGEEEIPVMVHIKL